VPGPADILRLRGRRAFYGRAGALAFWTLVLAARGARAESERLVVGTRDAALSSALSVAVSPRGLSVFELPEPLASVADVEIARHEVSVPGTVAVVWLCDDQSGAHALCFCGRDGRLSVKPLSVTSPLAPPDAAAVALSVKMLLGAPTPAPAPAPQPPRQTPAPPPPPPAPAPPPLTPLPTLSLEVTAGARVQSAAAGHFGLRVGLKGVLAPEGLAHALGVGVGLTVGPGLAAGGTAPAGRTVDDSAVALFARGRLRLEPLWLELDLGPSLHFLSVGEGSSTPDRNAFALDALAGAVLRVGRTLVGVRAGGFYVLTSPTAVVGAAPPLALPRWSGEVMMTLGLAFL
jgi:hypothetical protein